LEDNFGIKGSFFSSWSVAKRNETELRTQFGKIPARDFPVNACYVSRRLKGGERSGAKSKGF
jgi:hypothetical protein